MEKPKYDVFLSHATPDKPVVEELARILKKRGFEPWLDKWNLVPGEPWQEAIEEALESCVTCAVCLGPSGTGPWQNEEMRAAIARRVSDRSRQFRVIPILLPRSERGEPGRLPAFLRATTWVEFRDTLDDEKALHRLISGLRGLPPGPDPGEAVAEGARPYQGLQVFDVGDALFFFGREALTEWVIDKLRDRSGSRFLAIIGPSGSGKSSLARAGLLASLKSGKLSGSDLWPIAICKPGAQPLESLAIALSGAARLGDSPSTLRELIRDLTIDPRMLHLTTRLSLRDEPTDRRLVLLVDQFEEVFTLCPDEAERQAIINNLLHAAAAAEGRTVIVLTLRADFYGRCAAYPDLAAAVSDRQSLVGPMTRDELRSAIERPAYLAGCELEGGLADLLLNEVESQPGSLPLLEHALLQIWDRKEGGRRFTIAAYHEIGGVAGALEKHAEEVYAGFSEEERETCRRVFLRLVQVDEQGRATKRRLGLTELAPASSPVEIVVSRLTNARLLTTDQEKQPTVELAHEALLNNWARLKQWIEQDREALRMRRRLDEAVAEWLGRSRDPAFLLEGGRLAQIEEWAESHAGEMGPDARELLAASIEERDQERQREIAQAKTLEEEQRRRADAEHQRAEEQTRARRRQRKWVFASGFIAAVAIIAAVTAFYLSHAAEQQRKIARAGELSELSRTVGMSNSQLGLLLATQALKMVRDAGDPYYPSVNSALRSALAKSGGIPLPSGPVVSEFVSEDLHILATIGIDRHVRLWDIRTGKPPLSSRDLGELPRDVDVDFYGFAAYLDGGWLLIASSKGSWLLNLKNPNAKLSEATFLESEEFPYGSTPLSADGRWLITRYWGSLFLRDLSASGFPIALARSDINGYRYTFSPDSLRLAAISGEGLVELRNLQAPKDFVRLKLPSKKPDRLLFSEDGQALFAIFEQSVGDFKILPILRNGIIDKPIEMKNCLPYRVGVRKGSTIFFCSWKSQSEVWSYRVGAGAEKETSWPFELLDFSGDGLRLALGDDDGNIYLQSSTDLKSIPKKIATQNGLTGLNLLPSRWLLTFGKEEAPRLWDLNRLPDIEGWGSRVFRHSNEEFPVTASGEMLLLRRDPASRQLRLWKLTGEPASQSFPGLNELPFSLDVSANGRWLAAVSQGGSLLLWQIKSDSKVEQPIVLANDAAEILGFSPGGRWLATFDYTKGERLWDLHNLNAPPHVLTNTQAGIVSVAFTPSEDMIATAGDRPDKVVHLRVLDKTGPRKADSPNPSSLAVEPYALAFSPDSQWLAIGGGGDRIQIWNTAGHDLFLESRKEVHSLFFSPDGRWLAAGGYDGTIQLWRWAEEETNPTPILLTGHTEGAPSVVFTPQGLMSAALDDTVRLWELRTEKLIELACQSAGRTLSKKEWKTYILSEPYKPDEPCPGLPKAPD